MKMMNFARGALGAAALLLGLSQARADYSVNPATASSPLTVCGFSVSNVLLPCHVMVNSGKVELFTATNPGMVGLAFGGSALSLGQATVAKSLPVVLPSNPDILNAAATLTAADGASTSVAGQNGVPVITGTPTAGSVYNIPINGQSEAVFTIGNAFVGTLQFETSGNNSATFTPRAAQVMGTKYRQTQVTGPGMFRINAASLTNVRVRVIALTSGTPSVQLNTTAGTGSVEVMNDVEMVDNTTGLSPSVKAGGAAALTDPAMTVQNPNEAAALTALNTAIGDCTAAAYAGSGTGTLCAVMKAIYGQAPMTTAPGGTHTQMLGIEGAPNGTPIPVSGTVTTKSGVAMASPDYRIGASVAGNNAQVFATGAKQMLHVRFCNKATADRSVKFYDKASTPVPGTDAIVTSIYTVPGQCAAIDFSGGGFPFVNGLAGAITGAGDSDTGSGVAAGDIVGLNIEHN